MISFGFFCYPRKKKILQFIGSLIYCSVDIKWLNYKVLKRSLFYQFNKVTFSDVFLTLILIRVLTCAVEIYKFVFVGIPWNVRNRKNASSLQSNLFPFLAVTFFEKINLQKWIIFKCHLFYSFTVCLQKKILSINLSFV